MWALWAGLAFLLSASGSSGLEATGIQIELEGGRQRCVSDTVRQGNEPEFKFKAVDRSDLATEGLSVTISDSNKKLKEIQLTTKPETWSVPRGKGGKYTICFKSRDKKGRVEFKETTVLPQQGPASGDIPEPWQPIEKLLGYAKDVAKSLTEDHKESEKLEDKWLKDDKVLRSRIKGLTVFTVIALISVSGWQLALLNKFFRSKKLM